MMETTVALQPQQVNLFNPSLVPKRASFSARHILTWAVVAFLAMAALGWWATTQTRTLRREVSEYAALRAKHEELAVVPRLPSGEVAPTQQEVASLEQSLTARQSQLDARRGVRDALKRGMTGPNDGPSALLRLIATTMPSSAWLTEVRVAGARIDIAGKALDAATVDGWLGQLNASGFLAARPLPAVRLERIEAPTPSGRAMTVYTFNISAALTAPFAEDGARP